jgi:hypothetical protein
MRAGTGKRSCEAPWLLDEASGRNLALAGAQGLQHEGDFGDPSRPLAYISLQNEILTLTRDEHECK